MAFVLLVPEQATEQHLQILSELAQMFSDRELRERLSGDADVASLHQHITAWQPNAPDQRHAAA
jgi:PTS system nitrogen regulatory IIA component